MQPLKFLPVAISLEELTELAQIDESLEIGDDLLAMNKMYDDMHLETLAIQILNLLDDKRKIVFLYQLIRSMGFQLTQNDLRKTIHISKNDYYAMLKDVRHITKGVCQYPNDKVRL